ncbi:LysR family transcriptional regulator [Alicyclobacillus vulcanalis]|uniref:DNA-binding transcriptional regulator, LysR family n=1 Tax=Alicyclobacillus vulcanalis TaxID=252246 RepID=A0A1N7JRV9_9BACL|nr:LysR family transcriptional regulator [Alicyclobacillus vulcanalis]SIS52011.1 DNA-binding transcriptional regulator, LysR family [Alicyclobacillus vulcanalis]
MELVQLEYFVAVAMHQSFRRAADAIRVSQPALSRSIQKLEGDLGAPLFVRTAQGVRLTPYGEAFLPHARQALAEVATGVRKVSELAGQERGTLQVGLIYSLGTRFLPDIIRSFTRSHPGVTVRLSEAPTQKLLQQLDQGEIDIAFCTPQRAPHLNCVEILREELVAIVPPDHALAQRASCRLTDLAHEPFVAYARESGIRHVIEKYCAEAGFAPRVAMEGVEDLTVAGLVAAGVGVAVVPLNPQLTQLPVRALKLQESCTRSVYMVWHAHTPLSPVARAFISFVKRMCQP